MNRLFWIVFVSFLGILTGCGTVPPSSGMPQPDASVVVGNDGPTNDSAAHIDTGTDAGTPGDRLQPTPDRATPDSGPVTVCRPTIRNDMSREMCSGAAMCAPNFVNPTCDGARACVCGLEGMEASKAQQADALCRTQFNPTTAMWEMDQHCRNAVLSAFTPSCQPGHVRCSVNLPSGTEYAPLQWESNTRLIDWMLNTDRMWEDERSQANPPRFQLNCTDMYSRLGSVQMCIDLNIGTQPITLLNMEGVGRTFYLLRGVSDRTTSAELEFSEPCRAQLRVYRPGMPVYTRTLVAYTCIPPF